VLERGFCSLEKALMDKDNAISIVKPVSNRRLKSIRNSLPVTIMCM
jgi:hypothetical protein